MRIVRLHAENVKALKALTVESGTAAVVTVGGNNGAGKSSALDSIAYALGGMSLVPERPIRDGEAEAIVALDLEGGLRVERKFTRTGDGIRSTLKVVAADGARYPSPQAMLDKLVGALSFDPLEFERMKPAEQRALLARIAGIDLDAQAKEIAALSNARLEAKRDLNAARGALEGATPPDDGAPMNETPASMILDKLKAAQELADAARRAEIKADGAKQFEQAAGENLNRLAKDIAEAESRLAALSAQYEPAVMAHAKASEDYEIASRAHLEAKAKVPDMATVQAELGRLDAMNAQARLRKAYDAKTAAVLAAEDAHVKATEDVGRAQERHRLEIERAAFPVEGLGLSDTGPTWNGVPLGQASQAERIRASLALGMALNPGLKVLLVRDGSLLDKDSRRLVAEMAAANDAQVWMEIVTDDPSQAAVIIADGEAR